MVAVNGDSYDRYAEIVFRSSWLKLEAIVSLFVIVYFGTEKIKVRARKLQM